jgi:hypothetical protein
MQRLHPDPDDLVGHVIEQGGWTHLNLPAIAEEESNISLGGRRCHTRKVGDLLHPEREFQAALDELKAAMGSMEFAAQYQQAPVPIGGNLIRWSWFKFYDNPPTPQPGDKLIVSWDTAQSSHQLADYSACVVLLVRKGTIYILDVILGWNIPNLNAASSPITIAGVRSHQLTPLSSRRKARASA